MGYGIETYDCARTKSGCFSVYFKIIGCGFGSEAGYGADFEGVD